MARARHPAESTRTSTGRKAQTKGDSDDRAEPGPSGRRRRRGRGRAVPEQAEPGSRRCRPRGGGRNRRGRRPDPRRRLSPRRRTARCSRWAAECRPPSCPTVTPRISHCRAAAHIRYRRRTWCLATWTCTPSRAACRRPTSPRRTRPICPYRTPAASPTGTTGWTNAPARSSAWSTPRMPSRLPTCTARRTDSWPTRFSRFPRAEISAHEGRAGSDPPVVAHRQPRSPSRHPHAAELDQPHQPVAVRTVRREQDEHPGVVDDPAGERPAHQAGQAEVAHGHRVRVAERPLGDLRRGPGTDARYGAQPSLRRRWRELNPLLQPAGNQRGSKDRAGRLEEGVELAPAAAQRRLRAVPGVGAWTAAEVAQRAFGDADAVSVGDFHLPGLVGWALAGRVVDDAGMLVLLAPYRPHRYRLVRLIELSGVRVPRRGPRLPVRDYRRI